MVWLAKEHGKMADAPRWEDIYLKNSTMSLFSALTSPSDDGSELDASRKSAQTEEWHAEKQLTDSPPRRVSRKVSRRASYDSAFSTAARPQQSSKFTTFDYSGRRWKTTIPYENSSNFSSKNQSKDLQPCIPRRFSGSSLFSCTNEIAKKEPPRDDASEKESKSVNTSPTNSESYEDEVFEESSAVSGLTNPTVFAQFSFDIEESKYEIKVEPGNKDFQSDESPAHTDAPDSDEFDDNQHSVNSDTLGIENSKAKFDEASDAYTSDEISAHSEVKNDEDDYCTGSQGAIADTSAGDFHVFGSPTHGITQGGGEGISVTANSVFDIHTGSLESSPLGRPCSSLVRLAIKFRKGVMVTDHVFHFKRYENCFVGSRAVDFMVESGMAETREDAIFLGQRFVHELNLFHHVCWDHSYLEDDFLFYKFNEEHETKLDTSLVSSHSSRTSLSIGEQPSFVTTKSLNALAITFRRLVKVKTHTYHFKRYRDSFIGKDAVDRMVEAGLAKSRLDAVFLGQRLMDELGLFSHVKKNHTFKDEYLFYKYDEDSEQETWASPMSAPGRMELTFQQQSSFSSFLSSLTDLRQSFSSHNSSSHTRSISFTDFPSNHLTHPAPTSILSKRDLAEKSQLFHSPLEIARIHPPQAPLRRASIGSSATLSFDEGHGETIESDPRTVAPQVPLRQVSLASGEASRTSAPSFAGSRNYRSDIGGRHVAYKKKKKGQKRISFGTVETRLYTRSLEYNPATSTGPSVGLGWAYKQAPSREIPDGAVLSDYGFSSLPKQKRGARILSREDREAILEDYGYTRREIAKAVRWNMKARKQRKETLNDVSSARSTNGAVSLPEYLPSSRKKMTNMMGSRHHNTLNASLATEEYDFDMKKLQLEFLLAAKSVEKPEAMSLQVLPNPAVTRLTKESAKKDSNKKDPARIPRKKKNNTASKTQKGNKLQKSASDQKSKAVIKPKKKSEGSKTKKKTTITKSKTASKTSKARIARVPSTDNAVSSNKAAIAEIPPRKKQGLKKKKKVVKKAEVLQ